MNQITYEERKAVYEQALQKWGKEAQTQMAIEEMAELTKEICKIGRGRYDMASLADEIADVTIMLEQLRLIYGVNDMVCDAMDYKIRRLSGRVLQGEPEEKNSRCIHHWVDDGNGIACVVCGERLT